LETFRVNSIEEAVELAYRFKQEGKYDWFRGQVQAWPPFSSLFRICRSDDSVFDEQYAARLEMICSWLSRIPELSYLLEPENCHEFFAVLQHYGVPTHYIDFTTDPGIAAYFSADTKVPPKNCESVIFCLNTGDLTNFWQAVKGIPAREGMMIELVSPRVSHLWRLEAQRGVFVYANYNWDVDYPLDRIVFPYSGSPAYPTPDQIYPEHKSHLEQLLDQYFFIEKGFLGRLKMKKLVDDKNIPINWVAQKPDPGNYRAEAFWGSAESLLLWNAKVMDAWLKPMQESSWESCAPVQRLRLSSNLTAVDMSQKIRFGVLQTLRLNPQLRERTVNWEIQGGEAECASEDICNSFRTIWNGMRQLPFTNDDIASAFATTFQLLLNPECSTCIVCEETSAVGKVLSSPIQVEFGCDDGSYSRGYVATDSLQSIIRSDFAALLKPELQDRATDVKQILLLMYNPKLLFDFVAFSHLFAQEVIPTQVATRRSLMLFNPARLITFGLT
jgi:hypothetical protein